MSNIYHIISEADWRNALENGSYQPVSLQAEGFIHFSYLHQVVGSANLFYANQDHLLLLVVDPEKLAAEVHYENTTGGAELFPHLYGLLNLEAVVTVLPLSRDAEGNFCLPSALTNTTTPT
jgi:uncharacterized protein (DUF952 family)